MKFLSGLGSCYAQLAEALVERGTVRCFAESSETSVESSISTIMLHQNLRSVLSRSELGLLQNALIHVIRCEVVCYNSVIALRFCRAERKLQGDYIYVQPNVSSTVRYGRHFRKKGDPLQQTLPVFDIAVPCAAQSRARHSVSTYGPHSPVIRLRVRVKT